MAALTTASAWWRCRRRIHQDGRICVDHGGEPRRTDPHSSAWRLSDRIGRKPLLIAGAVGFAVFGGTAPYVATWLVARTGNEIAPAYYVIAAAIVTLLTLLTTPETAGRPLRQLGSGSAIR